MIQPVVEFFPLKPTLSKGGVNLELFPTTSRAEHRYNRELREALDSPTARGIYVFYDTRGQALYVGKAARQSLWRESCSALNRPRRTQQVFLVNHPRPNVSFVPPEERARQIRKTNTELSKLASYLSAYKVDQEHISDIEALLIRAFANDLLNSQMARFNTKDGS